MRFRLLGPLEVRTGDGSLVDLGGPKPRALLTLLLSEAGRVVSVDRVIATLWGDAPPPGAIGTVQAYVSQTRRLLGRDLIVTRSPGYLAAAEDAELDLVRLPALLDEAADRPGDAVKLLTEAVELWRGDPLADLPDDPLVVAERARLADLHLLARQRRAVAWAAVGRTAEAVTELERLVAEQPLRESLWAALIEALYAAGRQADALDAYRRCARLLADELGIDPSPALRSLEQAVLRQDPALGPHPRHAPPGRSDHLVGRHAEQARLRAALAEVTRGNGAVVALEGEAGIGKTRLAEAAAAMAGAQGWRSAWSRCADDDGVPALWPWLQILERLDGRPLHATGDGDPTFALFQELRARLTAAATATPVLVVLDDVQAADATSLALLALLTRHLDGVRLLVVLTVRTIGEELGAEVVDCLAALAREPRAQRLQLTGLTPADVRELIAPRAGAADVDDLARVVHERTDGNPFFAGELAELAAAEGRVDTLPPSVRDVLDRRLARLSTETVELLRLAAVIGRDAGLTLLEAASGLDAEQVITRLEPAVGHRVLRFDESAWRWRFSHALVRETLVAGLSRIAAARLHARVARALGDGAADVDRLAHHYFHAVPVTGAEPARRYAEEAAAAARDLHAHAEASMQTRRALALLGPDPQHRHRLLVMLGDDLLRAGRLTEAQEVVAEAIAVARRLGDHDKLAAAASVWGGVTLWNWRAYGVVDESMVALLEELAAEAGERDPALRARLLGTLGVELAYSSARRGDSAAYAERAVVLARTLDDPELLGRTVNNYMISTWGSADRVERWLAASDEALALAGRGLPLRTEFFARLHRGPLLLHLGDAEGFEADLAAATRLAARLTGPDVQPHLLYQETGRAMLRGQWAEAEEHANRAYDSFQQTSLWGAQFCRALHTFSFRRLDGRLGEVVGELVDAADRLAVPLLHGTAVLAAAGAGDLVEARRLRRRWPDVLPRDWTTDAVVVVRAWVALALGGDIARSYGELLPFRGRQIVVGTAGACWGSYDLELARLASALGRPADEHRREAALSGRRVGSEWQVQDSSR
ncbi:AAA family ATPase [Actinoplanes sp. LDG1-06]|uniref:AAA family ATPase n=1 Tax=Paractinoplanes ovalisporus TaxID=2810368 RepID=A0ABS2A7Y2_9ACTN|nr:BTAD domain-containing putative transcriptional regulator [Actinoplanes ovalisporus]MBM2615954.1 AAA family ATPase [Actinoplanes ovalisporus]